MEARIAAAVVLVFAVVSITLVGMALAQSSDPLVEDVIAIVTAAAEGKDIEPLLDTLSRKYVAVTPAPTKTPKCTVDSSFVVDVTVPDHTRFDGGEGFEKVWRFRNTGTCTWDAGYVWVFTQGNRMGAGEAVNVPATAPGETVDLKVRMTAPSSPGTYEGTWQMRSASGWSFGDMGSVVIQVNEPSTPTPTPTIAPDELADMHEAVIVGDWLIYVYKIHRQRRVWYYETAVNAENGVYAIVRLKVNNLTLDTVTMDEQLEFEVHDDKGRVFEFLKGQTADRGAHRHVPNHADVFFKMPPGVIDYPVLLTFDVAEDSQELWLDVYNEDRSEKASIRLAPCQSDDDRICDGRFIEAEPKE